MWVANDTAWHLPSTTVSGKFPETLTAERLRQMVIYVLATQGISVTRIVVAQVLEMAGSDDSPLALPR